MCGILGIIGDKYTDFLEPALGLISHRGPDDTGTYRSDSIALGHQRLSILDLSEKGHQPMFSADKRYVIVFNGEIYNHLELREQLKHKYSFKSTTDTETVLCGYQEWGLDIFGKLNGIFALCIYDTIGKEVILVRDQFGIKPLYFYQRDGSFFFGSEIKSFLKIPGWDKTIDHTSLVNYTNFLWSPGVQTPFKYVHKLESGHMLRFKLNEPGSFTIKKYYDIPFDGTRDEYSEEEWIAKIDESFTKAVERQLLSDVPLGFFLSGGLDSSIIVAKAKELMGGQLECFTVDTDFKDGYKEGFTDDLGYAKKVAKHLDVKLNIIPSKVDIVADFDKMIWHLDEPQADAAPLQVLSICQAARANNTTVLLGGAGGDDLFSGYRRHQALQFEKAFKYLPTSVLSAVASVLPSGNATLRRAKKLLKDSNKPLLDRLAGYYQWLPLDTNRGLYSNAIKNELGAYKPNAILLDSLANIPAEKDPLNTMLYWDMKYFLTDHNLNYTDKLSMAVGVESRVPFLDLDLVNMSTRIPTNLKLKGNTAKYILKKVAEKYLPQDVIYRPKTGFGAPVRKWITTDMDEMIHEYLSPQKLNERGIYDAKAVWKLIEDNKKGKIDASYPIWGLLAVESWMRQFVDNKT
jgi:asparagine synthase (glutamine-hydrolysing)